MQASSVKTVLCEESISDAWLQVWDVSQSVDSPQLTLGNPAPHAFTSVSLCPGLPVIAAGDSAGTVTVMRLHRPRVQAEAEAQQLA